MTKPPPPSVGSNFGTNTEGQKIFIEAQSNDTHYTALVDAVKKDAVLKLELNMPPDQRGAPWKYKGTKYHVIWKWQPKPTTAMITDIHT